jgi:hypothetical protein
MEPAVGTRAPLPLPAAGRPVLLAALARPRGGFASISALSSSSGDDSGAGAAAAVAVLGEADSSDADADAIVLHVGVMLVHVPLLAATIWFLWAMRECARLRAAVCALFACRG